MSCGEILLLGDKFRAFFDGDRFCYDEVQGGYKSHVRCYREVVWFADSTVVLVSWIDSIRGTNNDSLRDAFSQYGQVVDCIVMT